MAYYRRIKSAVGFGLAFGTSSHWQECPVSLSWLGHCLRLSGVIARLYVELPCVSATVRHLASRLVKLWLPKQ